MVVTHSHVPRFEVIYRSPLRATALVCEHIPWTIAFRDFAATVSSDFTFSLCFVESLLSKYYSDFRPVSSSEGR
nr:MAG TPA: hypothetical protein [Caudoviricetes sp.]